MRNKKNFWKLTLAVAILGAPCFSGCGAKQAGPLSEGAENSPSSARAKPAEPPLDEQTAQKLEPLTKDDINLYLKIMRAAAERVKNPSSADKAALESAKKILAGGVVGRVPTQDDVKTLELANQVAIFMDQMVAEEMKVDGRTYRGIAEAVESVILKPAAVKTSGASDPPAPENSPTPLEKRLSEVDAANAKFLEPYRKEIQTLVGAVRNPDNLPK